MRNRIIRSGNRNGRRNYYPAKNKNTNMELMRAIRSVQIVKDQRKDDGQEIEEVKLENNFTDFGLSEQLLSNITFKEYTIPTPIQDQAIPYIMNGRDVIGIANTGTGKTGAFLIPLIEKVFRDRNEKVLILTPTRELALQIDEEIREFSKGMGINTVLCIGGMSLGRQRMLLNGKTNFVIGTPGRIKDLINRRILFPGEFRNVVLDEADRMIDIGFINEVKYFISLLPQNRQSLFFSATIPPKVKEVLVSFVHNPVTVSVKKEEMLDQIHHDVIKVIDRNKKVDQLHDLLIKEGFEKVIVFGRTKWGIQRLTEELIRRGFKAGAIHGNKNQNQRQRTLEMFKRNEIKILLATDVASRGLDIDDVSHVINYDMPATMDDYIHRIGRTGRANKQGVALTFVD